LGLKQNTNLEIEHAILNVFKNEHKISRTLSQLLPEPNIGGDPTMENFSEFSQRILALIEEKQRNN
tara:strand:- start:4238 stop:4435 length:198 start_codon:yes stop_codon:yes gene_type:complete